MLLNMVTNLANAVRHTVLQIIEKYPRFILCLYLKRLRLGCSSSVHWLYCNWMRYFSWNRDAPFVKLEQIFSAPTENLLAVLIVFSISYFTLRKLNGYKTLVTDVSSDHLTWFIWIVAWGNATMSQTL